MNVTKNGSTAMWKWAVGTLLGVGVTVAAGVITIKTDIAAMKVDIGYIKDTIAVERGMDDRQDRDIQNCRERIIKLEAGR